VNGMTGKKIDLFKLAVGEDKLHQNFKALREEKLPYAREVLSNWVNGFVDRDNKVVKEFQTTFNSTFWELYLFSVIKYLKLQVDFTKDRPDFNIIGTDPFCLEATIASNPNGGQAEWEKDFSAEQISTWSKEKLVDNATLRLANAFISKAKKYSESYSKRGHVQELPYVIAIAPFDSPYFYLQNQQAIRRVLYGTDRIKAIDWSETEREIIEHVGMDSIEKKDGIDIQLGYFNSDKFSYVSAVIFSSVATMGKARMISSDPRLIISKTKRYNDNGTQPIYQVLEKRETNEHLLDGLTVYHNPYARFPFNVHKFLHPEISHVFSKDFTDIPHLALLQREVIVINNSNTWTKKRRLKYEQELKTILSEEEDQFPIIHN
jgi:hypothetical protein